MANERLTDEDLDRIYSRLQLPMRASTCDAAARAISQLRADLATANGKLDGVSEVIRSHDADPDGDSICFVAVIRNIMGG